MPLKQLSNFGHLLDILSISTVDLSKEIHIERTSISRWRTGARRMPVDMPYFEQIIDYLLQKNRTLGNGLLEDFFEGIYPEKKRSGRDYLRKCVRSYILNIHAMQTQEHDELAPQIEGCALLNYYKYYKLAGRRNALAALLDAALQTSGSSRVTIFSFDHLEWTLGDPVYVQAIATRLKSLLDMGNKVDLIFNVTNTNVNTRNYDTHKILLQMALHENLSIFTLMKNNDRLPGMNIYVLAGKVAILGYCAEQPDAIITCLFRDRQCVLANERILKDLQQTCTRILVSNDPQQLDEVAEQIRLNIKTSSGYFSSAQILDFTTMSEELLYDILNDNYVNEAQRRRCFEIYQLLRLNVQNGWVEGASGYYYVLDEITAPLANRSIVHPVLSAITNKTVQMSNQQYLQHFRDTAELLQKDERFRVVLHSTPSPKDMSVWYCAEAWAFAVGLDHYSGKIKYVFDNNIKTVSIFQNEYQNAYNRIASRKKENGYVAGLFWKIGNGELY